VTVAVVAVAGAGTPPAHPAIGFPSAVKVINADGERGVNAVVVIVAVKVTDWPTVGAAGNPAMESVAGNGVTPTLNCLLAPA
jgi:hypothetical protein